MIRSRASKGNVTLASLKDRERMLSNKPNMSSVTEPGVRWVRWVRGGEGGGEADFYIGAFFDQLEWFLVASSFNFNHDSITAKVLLHKTGLKYYWTTKVPGF